MNTSNKRQSSGPSDIARGSTSSSSSSPHSHDQYDYSYDSSDPLEDVPRRRKVELPQWRQRILSVLEKIRTIQKSPTDDHKPQLLVNARNELGNLLTCHSKWCNMTVMNGQLPLHIAAANNVPLHYVRRLLNSNKVDVNAQDQLGNTALHLTESSKYVKIARVLIEEGKARCDIANVNGKRMIDSSVIASILNKLSGKGSPSGAGTADDSEQEQNEANSSSSSDSESDDELRESGRVRRQLLSAMVPRSPALLSPSAAAAATAATATLTASASASSSRQAERRSSGGSKRSHTGAFDAVATVANGNSTPVSKPPEAKRLRQSTAQQQHITTNGASPSSAASATTTMSATATAPATPVLAVPHNSSIESDNSTANLEAARSAAATVALATSSSASQASASAMPLFAQYKYESCVDWTVEQVASWVAGLGEEFGPCAEKFIKHRVHGRHLKRLTKAILVDDLGIEAWGLYSEILEQIDQLQG